MKMNDESALTLFLFMQLKEALEPKYGLDANQLAAVIANDVTMRPHSKLEAINFSKNNRELIEDAKMHVKRFPDIIDTISALIDVVNQDRRKQGEHEAAIACLERARQDGFYEEDSPGKKEMLSHCDGSLDGINLDDKSSNQGGCLGVVLAFVGLSSSLLTASIFILLMP